MPQIDVSQISGYESMTAEQRVEALLKLDIPERVDLSQYVSKADHERLSGELETLRKNGGGDSGLAEQLATLQKNYDALQKENSIAKVKARFLSMPGYTDDLAAKAAAAMVDNDHEKLFDIQVKANEEYKKQLEADGLKGMKKPINGKPPAADDEALELAKKLGQNTAKTQKALEGLKHYM